MRWNSLAAKERGPSSRSTFTPVARPYPLTPRLRADEGPDVPTVYAALARRAFVPRACGLRLEWLTRGPACTDERPPMKAAGRIRAIGYKVTKNFMRWCNQANYAARLICSGITHRAKGGVQAQSGLGTFGHGVQE